MSSKANRQPGAGKTECPNCPGAYFKNVASHQFMARCSPATAGSAPAQLELEGDLTAKGKVFTLEVPVTFWRRYRVTAPTSQAAMDLYIDGDEDALELDVDYEEKFGSPDEDIDRAAIVTDELSKRGATMDCVDCKLKDRDIQDRDKEIASLTAAAAPQAPNLAEALAHAQAGGCSKCTTALQEFSQDLVAKAIPELSDDAVRALAIERKVIPETITVEMPARS